MRIRGTATDKLDDVIQTLRFVRKTGILTIQRDGPGDFFEQGTIVLQDGQIVNAFLGNLRGSDALKKLSTWRTCHFVFQATPSTTFSPSTLPVYPPRNSLLPPDQPVNVPPRSLPAPDVPHRAQQYQEALPDFARLGLSRLHRQLFLLIDGRRSIVMLTRLIRRDQQEVLQMLAEMENVGIIRR